MSAKSTSGAHPVTPRLGSQQEAQVKYEVLTTTDEHCMQSATIIVKESEATMHNVLELVDQHLAENVRAITVRRVEE